MFVRKILIYFLFLRQHEESIYDKEPVNIIEREKKSLPSFDSFDENVKKCFYFNRLNVKLKNTPFNYKNRSNLTKCSNQTKMIMTLNIK